jgi:hypothetical protein
VRSEEVERFLVFAEILRKRISAYGVSIVSLCVNPLESAFTDFKSLLELREKAKKMEVSAEYYDSINLSDTAKERRNELAVYVTLSPTSLSHLFLPPHTSHRWKC